MKKDKETDEDILNYIDDSFDQLETNRAEELERAKRLQQINNNSFVRERERLARKYGPDHPKVRKLEDRISSNKKVFAGLDAEIERSKVKTEPFSNTSWRIHGRVFDQKDNPLQGYTVFFQNDNEQGNNDLEYACTDQRGYYAITLAEKQLQKFENNHLYLAVSERNGEVLYRSSEPVVATKGVIDYKDILIGGEDCAKPPSGSLK